MKRVKMILSIAAVMFAVAGALATSNIKSSSLAVDVALKNATNCPPEGTCSQIGQTKCRDENQSQLAVINGTACSEDAFGTFTPAD